MDDRVGFPFDQIQEMNRGVLSNIEESIGNIALGKANN